MAQLKDTTIDGNLLVSGAATFEDAAATRQGLIYMKSNPHGGIDNDTPATWAALGSGSCWVGSGRLNNQPGAGFLENRTTNDGVVSQVLTLTNGSGETYHREGDLTYEWYAGTRNWSRYTDSNNRYKTLWEGSWSSGSITIPNLMRYRLFSIQISGHGSLVLAVRYGSSYLRGIGGYTSSTLTNFTYHFGANIGDDEQTLTYVGCNYMYHSGEGSHGPNNKNLTITAIFGIV